MRFFKYLALTFIVFFIVLSSTGGQAHETTLEPSINGGWEMDIQSQEPCIVNGIPLEGSFSVFIRFNIVYTLSPHPYNDSSEGQGYWTHILSAHSDSIPGQALPFAYQGRYNWGSFSGCKTNAELAQLEQDLMNDNLYVRMQFVFPDDHVDYQFSDIGTVIVKQPSIVAPTQLVSVDKMSSTPDPINIATGEMYINATDFAIEGRGPSLALTRMYRSQSNHTGLFGYGWRSAFDINLVEDSSGNVIIHDEQGTASYFSGNASVGYTASAGNYSTLVKNPDNSFTVTSKHGIVTDYAADGRLSAITDRNGNTLQLVYDPLTPNGTYIEDDAGRRITLTLDTNGRVTQAVDPAGNMVDYSYNTNGQLQSIIDAEGGVASYLYDADGNITQMTNVNGNNSYFAYDAEDRAYQNWQDGDVNEITLNFISDTSTVTTDSLGNQTTYVFNEFGLEVSRTNALGGVMTTAWDNDLNRTSVTDENGNTTTFSYDADGNLIQTIDALGNATDFGYTSDFHLIASQNDALGFATTYQYDANGNLINVIDPIGAVTVMTYNADGDLVQTTDARGSNTLFAYDTNGYLTQTTDALGNVSALTYDIVGNNTQATNANGASTTFSYDALNRLTQTNFADSTSVAYQYDAFGNRTAVVDQRGNATTNTYDGYERLQSTTDARGGVTQYDYDSEGRLLSLTDANGNTTTYAYDALGRLTSESTELGKTTMYTYDAVGNLTSKTDANGATINYTYDALNRLTLTQYPDATQAAYTYDALGRQTSMTDAFGTTNYVYDGLGRLISEDGPGAADTISYTYDALGNRLTMTDQAGNVTSYTYDALNRLTALEDTAGTTQFHYDAVGNKLSSVYPNLTDVTTVYDVMNRPTSVTNSANGTVISSFDYTYDAAGQVITKVFSNGTGVTYTYDATNQLLSEVRGELASAAAAGGNGGGKGSGKGGGDTGGAALNYDISYAYDAVGNRTSWIKVMTLGDFWANETGNVPQAVVDALSNGGYENHKRVDQTQPLSIVKTYTNDADNRLNSYSEAVHVGGDVFNVRTVDYTYDNNGNRLTKTDMPDGEASSQTVYGYDAENRLVTVDYSGVANAPIDAAAYAYDGNGLRKSADEGGTVVTYLYDGNNVIIERNALGEQVKSYTRAAGAPGGIGGLVSLNTKVEETVGKGKNRETILVDKSMYYHYDAIGSVTNLSDDTGSSVASYEYDAYGNVLASSGDAGNTYQFSSKEFEDHAGLIYFGARYYDPEIGRWLTPDPLGFIDGPNVYVYVSNNPLNLIDPLGFAGEKSSKSSFAKFLDGVKSYFKGVYGTTRYAYRLAGFAGSYERLKAKAEGAAVNYIVKQIVTNPEVRDVAIQAAFIYVKQNKARVAGRALTGVGIGALSTVALGSPAGQVVGFTGNSMATFGTITNGTELGADLIEDFVISVIGGE